MYHCIVLLNFFARGWRTKLGTILLARWCKQCRNFWRVGTKNYRKRKGWRKVKGVSKKKKREELFFLEELYKLHMSTWTRPMNHLLDLEGFSQVLNDLLIDS